MSLGNWEDEIPEEAESEELPYESNPPFRGKRVRCILLSRDAAWFHTPESGK